MRYEKLNEISVYAYSAELEALFGAFSLLDGEGDVVKSFCEPTQVAAYKRRYRFLFETFASVKKLHPHLMFDFLLEGFGEGFSLQGFLDFILSVPAEKRLARLLAFDHKIDTKLITKALTDDGALQELYAIVESEEMSFLAFASYIRQNEQYLKQFFAMAAELLPTVRQHSNRNEKLTEGFHTRLVGLLKTNTPLETSQELMGKTFRNTGPFEEFVFVPTLFLPFRALRFFFDNGTAHNRQILIYSLRENAPDLKATVEALKALSDETRYQILKILAKEASVNGLDIARTLKLAPSTVSHHMTELKNAGLITEEPVKTAKYYCLAKNAVKSLLTTVERDLGLE